MQMTKVIGHRGCAAHAPENSLAGIRDAARVGCGWIEADATLLADGTVVLFHDDSLDRCTNATGFIRELNWSQAIQLDVGQWFGDGRFVGERMPLLKDALACCHALNLGFNIELKTHRGEGEQLGQAVAKILGEETSNTLVSSFDQAALLGFRQKNNHCPLALIYDELSQDWEQRADDLNAVSIHLWERTLTKETVEAVKQSGRELYVFTVNDRKEAMRLWAMGVDGVFSDTPDAVLSV